jgi:hypothetical protein
MSGELGFAGMLLAGADPQTAWDTIHAQCADPAVRSIIANLAATEDGRAALEWSRAAWARYGLPPPWEDSDD